MDVIRLPQGPIRQQQSHAFISYVQEDYESIQRLYRSLSQAGIRPWFDRNDIPAGARWKRVIRQAIDDGAFFLGCFSRSYILRSSSYMNVELSIAVDRLRKMSLDRRWFIPILLEPCEVPDFEISPTETLRDLQQVRLYQDWDQGVSRIVESIRSDSVTSQPQREAQKLLRVLFLGSSPRNMPLQLDREVRELQAGIITSQARPAIELTVKLEPCLDDVIRLIQDGLHELIHFSGIASHEGMFFATPEGSQAVLSPAALKSALQSRGQDVECIVFNTSAAAEMAAAAIGKAEYVVCMAGPLSDETAISFAAGFYKSLGDGCGLEEAFDRACSFVRLEGFSENTVPTLLKRRVGGL